MYFFLVLIQSTVFGMVFAFLLLVSKRLKLLDDSKGQGLFPCAVSVLLALLAACGIAVCDQYANPTHHPLTIEIMKPKNL